MSGFRSSKYGRQSSKSRVDEGNSGRHLPCHFRSSSRKCTTAAPENVVLSKSNVIESEQLVPYLLSRKPRIATTRLRSPSYHEATRRCSFKSGADDQLQNRSATLGAPITDTLRLVDGIRDGQEMDSKDDKRESSITSTWKPASPEAILKVKACSQTQMKRYDYSSTNDESIVEPRLPPPRLRSCRDFSKAPNKPQLNLRRSKSLGLTLGFESFNYESSTSACTITTTTNDTLASSEITTTECAYCQRGQICHLCDCLRGSGITEPDTEQLRRFDYQRRRHDLMSSQTNVSAASIWHGLAGSTECDAMDATTVLDDGEMDDNPAWPETDHELAVPKEIETRTKFESQYAIVNGFQQNEKKRAKIWRKSLEKLSIMPRTLFEPVRFPLIFFVVCFMCCWLLTVKSCALCWLYHHMGDVTKNWLGWMPYRYIFFNVNTKMSFGHASFTQKLEQMLRGALDLIQYVKYSAYMPRGSLQDWWENRAKL